MTDNDIIKDLEEMAEYPQNYEKGQKLKSALNLINRQKAEIEKNENIIRLADKTIEKQSAEIERLQNILISFMGEVENWEHKYNIDTSTIPKIAVLGTEKGSILKHIKSEAIKEFSENFRKELFDEIRKTIWSVNGPFQYEQDKAYAFGCIWSCITNKLEELVGD